MLKNCFFYFFIVTLSVCFIIPSAFAARNYNPEGVSCSSDCGRRTIDLGIDAFEQYRYYIAEKPTGTAPTGGWPVIILFHGGGGDAEQWFTDDGSLPMETSRTFKNYAVNGRGGDNRYAVIAVESKPEYESCVSGLIGGWIQGHPRWMNDWPTAGLYENEDLMVIDEVIDKIKTGQIEGFIYGENNDEIETFTDLNQDRIYMAGFSEGAGMTIVAAEFFKEDVKAASPNSFGHMKLDLDSNKCSDVWPEQYDSYYIPELNPHEEILHMEGCNYLYDDWDDYPNCFLRRVSTYWDPPISSTHPPVFIKHAWNDLIVNYHTSIVYRDKLEDMGITVSYNQPTLGGHDWLNDYDEALLDFFDTYE